MPTTDSSYVCGFATARLQRLFVRSHVKHVKNALDALSVHLVVRYAYSQTITGSQLWQIFVNTKDTDKKSRRVVVDMRIMESTGSQ
jgi:hypothetical protein